jgi:hypothetical protein
LGLCNNSLLSPTFSPLELELIIGSSTLEGLFGFDEADER